MNRYEMIIIVSAVTIVFTVLLWLFAFRHLFWKRCPEDQDTSTEMTEAGLVLDLMLP